MKTAQQREKQFRDELGALLKRHGAEMEVVNVDETYNSSYACRISMRAVWDIDDSEMIRDFCEFDI